jgi:hypothetical protein
MAREDETNVIAFPFPPPASKAKEGSGTSAAGRTTGLMKLIHGASPAPPAHATQLRKLVIEMRRDLGANETSKLLMIELIETRRMKT